MHELVSSHFHIIGDSLLNGSFHGGEDCSAYDNVEDVESDEE